MSELSNAMRAIGNLPNNLTNKFPSGKWGFVGRCDARLLYTTKDGSPLTEELQRKIAMFGGGMVGNVKSLVFDTEEHAIDFAHGLGLEVTR